LDIELDF
jgi:hypothetical protein